MLNKKGFSSNKDDYLLNPYSRLFHFNRIFRLIHNYRREKRRRKKKTVNQSKQW